MQQLQAHYERHETEELLEIAKKDLTDEARTVLTHVLTTRGVSSAQVAAAREQGAIQQARAAEAESRLAPRWKRLIAFGIDVWGILIALLVVFLPLQLISTDLQSNAALIVWLGYFFFRDGLPGQSIGKRLMRVKVEQFDSGKSPTWANSFARNAPHMLFVLDALFILGSRRMRLGDMLAGTVVVRANA